MVLQAAPKTYNKACIDFVADFGADFHTGFHLIESQGMKSTEKRTPFLQQIGQRIQLFLLL